MSYEAWMEAALANPSLVDEIYEKFEKNPNSVDSSWYFAFTQADQPRTATVPTKPQTVYEQSVGQYARIDSSSPADLRIYNLIIAYRTYGHLQAHFNPIATKPIEQPRQLRLETLGFNQEELSKPFPTCGLLSSPTAPLSEIIETLKSIYCDKIGIEFMELEDPDMENWIIQHIEPTKFKADLTIDQKRMILQSLNRSELFETFIHTRYTGQKRFSLEGCETLIPMLESTIELGSTLGSLDYVIGMAHRGRLNVLSNILNKSHTDIFSEFEEGYIPNSFEGSGDVKYHKGYFSEVSTSKGQKVKVTLSPNPSHLESVDPVVEGQVRAQQVSLGDDLKQEKVIPILVHGDAAIAGQGVVYETMQFYHIPGYSTGGTLHFVINNQIGFTATPNETRSTWYCTDIANAFSAPVFHVNSEDPEGCVYVTNLAMELRQKFHCDVFIDINCYRKYGHNESDEPAYTQPLEYQIIRKKKSIREIYRDQLISEGVMEQKVAESLEAEFTAALQLAMQESKNAIQQAPRAPKIFEEEKVAKEKFPSIPTKVPKETLVEIAERITSIPEGFNIHPKLKNLINERLEMVKNKKPIDWGMAENLAYGSILWDGTSIRISGQDVRRGTFSHRHGIWMDQVVEKAYIPLSHLKPNQGRFDLLNSPLSEYAVLGFEYGYSVGNPEALVIWEAQFGDFGNGAQIMIDQYIATSEQKWGQKLKLVLFLPHGYEGQGPEHSSGRMERFLQLAAEDNMRIVDPTTPAQFFHLLRKQVAHPLRKPLIVFTPKGLLRHPACVSSLKDLTHGSFQEVLDDPNPGSKVKRLVLCTGRIYYDLIAEREKSKIDNMAIIRIEQLYPLHKEQLLSIIKKYKGIKEAFWVQEEPSNMGAWNFINQMVQPLMPKSIQLQYIGRPRSASPAVGSYLLHKKQHADIMNALFKGAV